MALFQTFRDRKLSLWQSDLQERATRTLAAAAAGSPAAAGRKTCTSPIYTNPSPIYPIDKALACAHHATCGWLNALRR
jgi:hypothetical protein